MSFKLKTTKFKCVFTCIKCGKNNDVNHWLLSNTTEKPVCFPEMITVNLNFGTIEFYYCLKCKFGGFAEAEKLYNKFYL